MGRAHARTMIGLAAAALCGPAPAIPPPIPEHHDLYGPVRACGDYYAFDAREGEGYGHGGGPPLYLRMPGGGIGFETWIYEFERDRDIVHPLGEIVLADGTQLRRIRMTSRNSPRSEIQYLYRIPVSSWLPYLSIRSQSFEGDERDRALLERIAFGDAARALCASVPEELRPTLAREDPDAGLFTPQLFAGPLTICMSGLAFDLRPGETARLPWSRTWPRFRIISGGRAAEVDLLMWQPYASAGPPGPLASDPGIALVEGQIPSLTYQFVPEPPDGPRHIHLVQRGPGDGRLSLSPRASFSLDRSAPQEESLALATRLRVQTPDEHCSSAPFGTAENGAARGDVGR